MVHVLVSDCGAVVAVTAVRAEEALRLPDMETGSCQALGAGGAEGAITGFQGWWVKGGGGGGRRGEEAGWKPHSTSVHPCTSHLDRMAEALMERQPRPLPSVTIPILIE